MLFSVRSLICAACRSGRVNRPGSHRPDGTLVSAHLSHVREQQFLGHSRLLGGIRILGSARGGNSVKLVAGPRKSHGRGVFADGSGEAA
jgi:hypothetical protein